jgi:hypothetical protein
MSSIIKNIIVVGGLLALAGLGYYLFVIEGAATLNTSGGYLNSQAEAENKSFLQRLEDIKDIELSMAIFNDDRFRSLTDFSSVIESVQSGRSNPFVDNNATTQ